MEQPSDSRQAADTPFTKARLDMVRNQLQQRDIVDESVLDAFRNVERHHFVPASMHGSAYDDCPLPIGHQQTISQPYIVALMTQLVAPQPHHKALDIGTGSGYQAAILSSLVDSVYSVEIVHSLAETAKERLEDLEYSNVNVCHGDGYQGWKTEAPFDIIIVAAAPDHIPQPLIDQLAIGGKMVLPVGEEYQQLILIEKQSNGRVTTSEMVPVLFVPMTGEAQK